MLWLLFVILISAEAAATAFGTYETNLIKINNIHDTKHTCTGILLNENYYLTSQTCVSQAATSHFVNIFYKNSANSTKSDHALTMFQPNQKFTVGWNNNFLIGKVEYKPVPITPIKISKNFKPTSKYFLLIGWENNESTKFYKSKVLLQPSKVCQEKVFTANKYFEFDNSTMFCGLMDSNNRNKLDYGSILIDLKGNLIGLFSIMDFNELQKTQSKPSETKSNFQPIVFTRLSSTCDYIESATQNSFKCL